MVKIKNKELFNLHADFCKMLANPKRLMILNLLGVKEMSVGEIADAIGVPLANISQHLNVLKNNGVVKYRNEGHTVYYSLVDPKLLDVCHMTRKILVERMKERGLLANEIDIDSIVTDE